MRAVVMYESMFGNSEKVARAVATGLEPLGDVVVRDVSTVSEGAFPVGTDLLVVGGPTHAFAMSRPGTREDAIRQGAAHGLVARGLREWLAGLPADLGSLRAATFDTRVTRVRRLPGSAARGAARVLRRRHAHLIAAPESFFVDDTPGPLDDTEVERARAWGRQLASVVLDEHVEAT